MLFSYGKSGHHGYQASVSNRWGGLSDAGRTGTLRKNKYVRTSPLNVDRMNDIETSTSLPLDSETRSTEERWHLLETRVPKTEIVYFSQIFIVYVIIITPIANLSLQNGSTELWISLLSSCIGHALPNPKLKK